MGPNLAKLALLACTLVLPELAFSATFKVGEKPETVAFRGEVGARVDGTPWSTEAIKDRLWLMFYVAPSRRDDNEALKEALKAENFPEDKLGSIAIINMASTWVPNVILESALKKNQERYPRTTYVKDLQKTLVSKWQLKDDSFEVLLFDRSGKVLLYRSGDFSPDQIKETIDLIKRNL
jgi:predicted transcriptional regulator